MNPLSEQAGAMGTAGQRGRHIGPFGTAARLMVGMGLLGSVLYGHVAGDFRPGPWFLGLVVFPAVPLAWQWWRCRRTPAPFEATGPVAQVLNVAVFAALYMTPDSLPVLWATSDATLVFYGASMLLAVAWGYAGCEVLAFSNWLLRRDDQVGCLLFDWGLRSELDRRSGFMNNMPKLVVSATSRAVEWQNSILISGDVADHLAKLKAQPGKKFSSPPARLSSAGSCAGTCSTSWASWCARSS